MSVKMREVPPKSQTSAAPDSSDGDWRSRRGVAMMPSGACVLRYEGVRGATWSVKFRDVDGRQVRERRGREADGWTRQRAERELGKRLDRVARERWRKPTGETMAALVDEFLDEYLPSRGRRRSTVIDYTNTLRGHVLPALGSDTTLAAIEARPELLDKYITRKRREKLAPKTIHNHLGTLSAMFEYARRRRRMQTNPVELLEPLHVPTPVTPVLREEEVAALLNAYRAKEGSAETGEGEWWALARRVTAFALGTALRRGEVLALRWGDVEMLEAGCTSGGHLFVARWASRSRVPADGRSGTGPAPRTYSMSSGRRRATSRTTRWCSATRRSGRPSTRRRSAATCGRRSRPLASSDRFDRGTICGIRR